MLEKHTKNYQKGLGNVPKNMKNSANKTEESEDQDKQKRKSGIAAGIKSAGIPKKFGGQ